MSHRKLKHLHVNVLARGSCIVDRHQKPGWMLKENGMELNPRHTEPPRLQPSNFKHEVEEKRGGRGDSRWTEYIQNEGKE